MIILYLFRNKLLAPSQALRHLRYRQRHLVRFLSQATFSNDHNFLVMRIPKV